MADINIKDVSHNINIQTKEGYELKLQGSVVRINADISGLQTKANLTTTLSASSTDEQYPSAKCVYDIIGDVETLLSAI